jgi:hypothetical protein
LEAVPTSESKIDIDLARRRDVRTSNQPDLHYADDAPSRMIKLAEGAQTWSMSCARGAWQPIEMLLHALGLSIGRQFEMSTLQPGPRDLIASRVLARLSWEGKGV